MFFWVIILKRILLNNTIEKLKIAYVDYQSRHAFEKSSLRSSHQRRLAMYKRKLNERLHAHKSSRSNRAKHECRLNPLNNHFAHDRKDKKSNVSKKCHGQWFPGYECSSNALMGKDNTHCRQHICKSRKHTDCYYKNAHKESVKHTRPLLVLGTDRDTSRQSSVSSLGSNGDGNTAFSDIGIQNHSENNCNLVYAIVRLDNSIDFMYCRTKCKYDDN